MRGARTLATTAHRTRGTVRTGWLCLVQPLAIGLMLLDHVCLFLLSGPWADLLRVTLGRGALPMFAAMIAWHALVTSDAPVYLRRVLLIAVLAQLPYALLLDNGLGNICWTFSAAIAVVHLVRCRSLWCFPALIAAIWFSYLVEYGVTGLFLVLSLVVAFRYPVAWLLPLLVWPFWQYLGAPFAMVSAFLSVLLIVSLVGVVVSVPRLPRPVTRWFYPVHFLFIALIVFAQSNIYFDSYY